MLYEFTVPQFKKMLSNLSHILDKAAASADARQFEIDVLLNARLAPDQFNFIRQVQIATDMAKLCVARLTGVTAPTQDDKEKTLAELKSRIENVQKYLSGITAKNFEGAAEKRIVTKQWGDNTLSGFEYALQHSLPNFYFHLTTAYAILRHNGVDVGKKDFIGELPFKK